MVGCNPQRMEIKFYKDKFNQYKTNSKLTWKTINCILNQKSQTPVTDSFLINNVLVTDETKIAKSLNEYFSNIGP